MQDITVQHYFAAPSLQDPAVVFAFGPYNPHLVLLEPGAEERTGAFIRETMQKATGVDGFVTVLGFGIDKLDASTLSTQKIDPKKPVEFLFGVLPHTRQYTWSDVEGPSADDVREAYKLVRRADGGLLVIDVFDSSALLDQAREVTLNGGLIGLTFSSRVAALPQILQNPVYQKGTHALENNPFDFNKFDPRIVVYNPRVPGILAVRDWILVSQPLPGGGSIQVIP